MLKQSKKVLISDASSYKSIVIAKYLKLHYQDVVIYSCDFRKMANWVHSKYFDQYIQLNSNLSQNYCSEISEIIKKYKIDLYIPVNSKEIDLVLQNKKLFGKSLGYLGDYRTFNTLNNKNKLTKLVKQLGVNYPRTYNNLAKVKMPFIIKPEQSSSAKGVKYIFTEEEKLNLKIKSNILIQEFVSGDGVGYSVFARRGKIVCGYGHKRICEYPISGGSSTYRQTYNNQKMRLIVEKILNKTLWSGFAMFEFKLTSKNELYLIEVNPRIWGSVNQGLQNGTNYFISLLPKHNYSNKEIHKDIKTYLSPVVYLSLLKYLFRGNFQPLFSFIKNTNSNRVDVSFFDDPEGYLSLLFRVL